MKNDEIREANLNLLIGLRDHLDRAAKLRALLDRLLKLAAPEQRRPNPREEVSTHDR